MSHLSALARRIHETPHYTLGEPAPLHLPFYRKREDSGIPRITIYNAETGRNICTADVCDLTLDPTAQKIYYYLEEVLDFFQNVFHLNGVDGRGKLPHLKIHWQQNNAQWTIEAGQERIFDVLYFNDRYVQPEIIAHEYMHAVISHIRPLNYADQSGALNESLADVMGTIFKQYLNDQTVFQGDWKIGNLRSLSLPPLAEQPAHMTEFAVRTQPQPEPANDFGHVYRNSGIPNHAFFLAAMALGGISWGRVGQIWFSAFRAVTPNETIRSFATRTVHICENETETTIVRAAWRCVGGFLFGEG